MVFHMFGIVYRYDMYIHRNRLNGPLHTYINDPTDLTSVDFTLSYPFTLAVMKWSPAPSTAPAAESWEATGLKMAVAMYPWQWLRLCHSTVVNHKASTQQRYSKYLGMMDEGWMDSALMMCLCSRASAGLKQTGSVLSVTPLPIHVFLHFLPSFLPSFNNMYIYMYYTLIYIYILSEYIV